MTPEEELLKNFEFLNPVKKCPQCHKLHLEFDPVQGRIFCTGCGFEKYMKK